LDSETRGFIEEALDEYEENALTQEDFSWIAELVPIVNMKDYILGYIIGRMLTIAFTVHHEATKTLLIFPKKLKYEDRTIIGAIVGRRATEVYSRIEQRLHQ
jgi:hypothetical protein